VLAPKLLSVMPSLLSIPGISYFRSVSLFIMLIFLYYNPGCKNTAIKEECEARFMKKASL
jgi:hypothetical protein